MTMVYSEADNKAKLITPKLKESGWIEANLVREHGFKYYFTDGRKLPGNKRGKRYAVDCSKKISIVKNLSYDTYVTNLFWSFV